MVNKNIMIYIEYKELYSQLKYSIKCCNKNIKDQKKEEKEIHREILTKQNQKLVNQVEISLLIY